MKPKSWRITRFLGTRPIKSFKVWGENVHTNQQTRFPIGGLCHAAKTIEERGLLQESGLNESVQAISIFVTQSCDALLYANGFHSSAATVVALVVTSFGEKFGRCRPYGVEDYRSQVSCFT